ncbi:MAG TPA: PH domain-containing protein [Edaphocola sp.]|nr:PH domain-containing protein [Edaphocola sp.]
MDQTPFQNMGIDLQNIQIEDVETLNFTPIEPKYWKVILLRFLILVLITTLLIGLTGNFFPEFFRQYLLIIIGGSLFVLLSGLFLSRLSFSKRSFAVRTHDILYRHGVLSNSLTIVPINRIQHVKITETFFMRFFRLASLEMFTAAGLQNGTIRIPGIKLEEAEKLRAFLLSRINEQNLDGK